MSERDEVQPLGSCPSSTRAYGATLMPQGARSAAAEKTSAVFRCRLTCDSRLSAAAEAIVCAIQRGCEYRATLQFARVAI